MNMEYMYKPPSMVNGDISEETPPSCTWELATWGCGPPGSPGDQFFVAGYRCDQQLHHFVLEK